jgi:stress response protein YsnF
MLSDRELSAAIGTTAYGPDRGKIGTVEHFFVDDRTGEPTWVAVSTGLFGTRHSIIPAGEARFEEGNLHLPVTRDAVRNAPSIGDTQHLDPDAEAVLREHYGLAGSAAGAAAGAAGRPTAGDTDTTDRADTTDTVITGTAGMAGTAAGAQTAGGAGRTDTVALPPVDTTQRSGGDGSMIRSEEQLRVSTEQIATTRVRVVKYVVTEEVQVTVPVRREEVRIEEVPLDAPDPGPGESLVDEGRHAAQDGTAQDGTARGGGGAAPATGGPAELPQEIVLHREEPVVSVRVVPAERVRLHTEVVGGQERVSAQMQREQIAVDEEQISARDGR